MAYKIALSYYPAITHLTDCPSYIRRDALLRDIIDTIDYDEMLCKYSRLITDIDNLKLSESGKKLITVTVATQIKLTTLQMHLVILTYNHIIGELNYKLYNQLLAGQ